MTHFLHLDQARRGPLIAVVGCDGSGKSTVVEEITRVARRFGPVEAVHLGKQAGNFLRAIARWPLIGDSINRVVGKQTVRARGVRGRTNPRLRAALVIYAFTLRRQHRFRRMLRLWRPGTIIVSDRFPQIDIPGQMDGPDLCPDDRSASWLVRWLASRERIAFVEMTGVRPDLVIRLDVDLETALARKPDHEHDVLRRKIAVLSSLQFGGVPIVDIDSRRPLAEVLTAATAAVSATLSRLGYTASGTTDAAPAAQLSSAASPSSSAASP